MTGVPAEIPQHIIEAAVERGARALDAYGLTSGDAYDAASDVLAAVWSEIQTHVREQVVQAIWTESEVPPGYGPTDSDVPTYDAYAEGVRFAAAVARGAARDGDTND